MVTPSIPLRNDSLPRLLAQCIAPCRVEARGMVGLSQAVITGIICTWINVAGLDRRVAAQLERGLCSAG